MRCASSLPRSECIETLCEKEPGDLPSVVQDRNNKILEGLCTLPKGVARDARMSLHIEAAKLATTLVRAKADLKRDLDVAALFGEGELQRLGEDEIFELLPDFIQNVLIVKNVYKTISTPPTPIPQPELKRAVKAGRKKPAYEDCFGPEDYTDEYDDENRPDGHIRHVKGEIKHGDCKGSKTVKKEVWDKGNCAWKEPRGGRRAPTDGAGSGKDRKAPPKRKAEPNVEDAVSSILTASAAKLQCDTSWEAIATALEHENATQKELIEHLVADLAKAHVSHTAQGHAWQRVFGLLMTRFDSLQANVKRCRNCNGLDLKTFYQENDIDLQAFNEQTPSDTTLMRHHVPHTDGKSCPSSGMVPCHLGSAFAARTSESTSTPA